MSNNLTKKVKEYYQHIKSKLTKDRKSLLLVYFALLLVVVFVGSISYLVYQKFLKPSIEPSVHQMEIGVDTGIYLTYDVKNWIVSTYEGELYFFYKPDIIRDNPGIDYSSPRVGWNIPGVDSHKYPWARIKHGKACTDAFDTPVPPDCSVKKIARDNFEGIFENYKKFNPEIIDDFRVVNVNGLDYYYFKYKITDTNLNATYYRQVYITEVSDKQNDSIYLEVQLSSTNENSQGSAELKNLLNNITVKNHVKSH